MDAARDCGGEAYVLFGVEPGVLIDVPYIDPASLSQKLKTYVDGPFWTPEYVEVDGKRVLVVAVAAPSPGDRMIHTLISSYNNAASGTVFVRGTALSEPANHRQMVMLQDRLMMSRREGPIERFKNSVVNGQRIEVADIVETAAGEVLGTVTDPGQFPVTFADRSPVGSLKEVIEAAERYRTVTVPLLELIAVGCRWGRSEHDHIWADVIAQLGEPRRPGQRVASTLETPAGPVQMLTTYDERLHSLSVLPATLTLYAGTIAALDGNNYGAIRALTTDALVNVSLNPAVPMKVPVITRIGPWDAVPDEVDLIALRAAQTGQELTDELLERIAQRQFRKRPFAWSSYLFAALEGSVGRHRYAELFDVAEVLFSMILADVKLNLEQPYVEPWLGKFVASESFRFEDSPAGKFLNDALAQGANWPPVSAGMFGGDSGRVRTAVEYLALEVRNAIRRGRV